MKSEIPEGETLSREYLANERTLLSWVRTGLNAIGVGVLLHAVARVLPELSAGPPSGKLPGVGSFGQELAFGGVAMVVLGVLIELAAVARFLHYKHEISRGKLTTLSLLYPLVALGLAMLTVAYIIYVLVS